MPTRTVAIPTPDGTADAFVAVPEGAGDHPAVLLYMDAFGLRPVIEEMAERLAANGYYVLAPNVLYRHGKAPVIELPDLTVPEEREAFFARFMPLLEAHTPRRAAVDAEAYLAFLAEQPEVRSGPIGVTGYCMGGVLAVRAAAAHPERVAAAAAFHPGPLVTDAPDSPHRLVPHLAAELHVGLAEQDDSMPPEAIAELTRALDAAGVRHTSEIYPDTVHGFTMSDTAAFSPTARDRHWDRLLSLFARTLKPA
ncbi:dienelactone hydrolase family protein [Streptomyces sp. NPDC059063]|uniref:dienelactone hydrolase family protein n=1 Tax=unclassified Streptomyces TaxID=2593676 RepID=UPI00368C4FB1